MDELQRLRDENARLRHMLRELVTSHINRSGVRAEPDVAIVWQPIETAPENKRVLVWMLKNDHYHAGDTRAIKRRGQWYFWLSEGFTKPMDPDDTPTHWTSQVSARTIPQPPSPFPANREIREGDTTTRTTDGSR